MNHKNLLYGIAWIVFGVLLLYFLYSEHKKLKNKTYTPNKKEAKEWPYIDNMEEIHDYGTKFSYKEGMIGSMIMIAMGIYNLYKFLIS